MSENFEPIPYRVRIGVTGHRHLEDPAAIETLVRSVLDVEIEKLFPVKWIAAIEQVRNDGITPITFGVLSALAAPMPLFPQLTSATYDSFRVLRSL
jgi:hypothetical protein